MSASVSVVIPCFRCSGTIERAVESVFKQTLRPYEVILVEDCSGDQTLSKLYEIKERYPEGWIKVVALEKNGGPGTARNKGWDLSRQEYIAFLDADDSWHPQKVEIQYQWMVEHPEAVLTGHGCDFRKEGDFVGDFSFSEKREVDRVYRRRLLMSNQFPTRSVMLKKDLSYRFKDGKRYCEDYLLWLQICFFGGACYRLPQNLSFNYKEEFGVGGLSGQLWEMQKGEVDSYFEIFRMGGIRSHEVLLWVGFSFVKFLRRLLLSRIVRR